MRQRAAASFVLLSFAMGSLLHGACDLPNDFSIDPTIDFNCDGKTSNYCGGDSGAIDLYTNALVTGFMVTEHLTYVLVGEPGFDQPDGIVEDFFRFIDVAGNNRCFTGPNAGLPCDPGNGNADCPFSVCGRPDGTTSFDPALAGLVITEQGDYADPAVCTGELFCDQVFFVPGGNATGSTNGDATPLNPNCDRFSQDQVVACSLVFLDQTTLAIPLSFPTASFMTLARGDVLELDFGPGGVDLSPVNCLGEGPIGVAFVDAQIPVIGDIFFYAARLGDGSIYSYGNSSPSCQDRFVPPNNGVCGEPCMPGDCISGFCVDGFCCDGPCDGECSACDVPGLEGTCASIPTGTDPDGECGDVSCAGYFWGFDGNDCHAVADAAGSCSGDGRCRSQEEECLVGAKGTVVSSCNPFCETPQSGTCSGTVPGSCEGVPGCMVCVGGVVPPGTICETDADCGGTCLGGIFLPDGAFCLSPSSCGGICVGGGFNGRPCSSVDNSDVFCINFGGVCNLDGVECVLTGECVSF